MLKSLNQHICLQINHDIHQFFAPALKLTNTCIINLIHVAKNGQVSYLCNHRDWLKHYLKNGYPSEGAFEQGKISILGSHVLWSALSETDPIVIFSREIFNINHGITIVRGHGHGTDYFNFGTIENEGIAKYKLENNLQIFNQFIDEFYERVDRLYTRVQRDSFDLSQFKGAVDDNKQFRNRLYLGPEYAYQYLTRRELSVLKQLITGKTFSKISSILNISSRTVEKHAENIKLKLQCDSQCQLGYLAAKLKLDEH